MIWLSTYLHVGLVSSRDNIQAFESFPDLSRSMPPRTILGSDTVTATDLSRIDRVVRYVQTQEFRRALHGTGFIVTHGMAYAGFGTGLILFGALLIPGGSIALSGLLMGPVVGLIGTIGVYLLYDKEMAQRSPFYLLESKIGGAAYELKNKLASLLSGQQAEETQQALPL